MITDGFAARVSNTLVSVSDSSVTGIEDGVRNTGEGPDRSGAGASVTSEPVEQVTLKWSRSCLGFGHAGVWRYVSRIPEGQPISKGAEGKDTDIGKGKVV